MSIDVDYDKLRQDLLDYYSAASLYNPMAVIEFYNVKDASNNKLVEIALENGFNISNYEKGKTKR